MAQVHRRGRLRLPRCGVWLSVTSLLIGALALLSLPSSAAGQSLCRFYVASQYDWLGNAGFYLDFEGDELATLSVFLAVGDGTSWRFPRHTPGFEFDREYQLTASVSATGAQLYLDGALVADSPGGWQPAPGPFEVDYRPPWASDPGDWMAAMGTLSVVLLRGEEEVVRHELDIGSASAHPALRLFEPGTAMRLEVPSQPGDSLRVDCTIRFFRSDPAAWAPLIDRYGQCVYAEFPGKVETDADLVAHIAAEDTRLEAMPPSPDFDPYGGYLRAGWREEGTGFFRVTQRDGYWWLLSPEGNPCFYLGVCLVPASAWPLTPTTGREHFFEWLPPREPPWSGAWHRDVWGAGEAADYVNLYQCNLIRKYGADAWQEESLERARRRLAAWGFSGGGKWGAPDAMVQTPVLYSANTPALAGHPDYFDPAVREQFRWDLEGQIGPRRDDPYILGWSYRSEWEALITRDQIRQILAAPADTPAKRALLDHAVDELYGASVPALAAAWGLEVSTREELYEASPSPPDADLVRLRLWYADGFYEFVYSTIKSIDPNHLVIAPWIVPGWWESEDDWRLQARHCDIMGYDRYFMDYDDPVLARLQAETDKPTLCGEFSFPQFYHGERGFGRYWSSRVETEAEAGELYHQTIEKAARDPHCVGMVWFHYRDQPLTGRGPGFGPELVYGEHYAFGLISETDQVKWPLVERMREVNHQAAPRRMEAAGRPFR